MNSCWPISRLDRPSAAIRAICSSCAVSCVPGPRFAAAAPFPGRPQFEPGPFGEVGEAEGVEGVPGFPQWHPGLGGPPLAAQPLAVAQQHPGPVIRPAGQSLSQRRLVQRLGLVVPGRPVGARRPPGPAAAARRSAPPATPDEGDVERVAPRRDRVQRAPGRGDSTGLGVETERHRRCGRHVGMRLRRTATGAGEPAGPAGSWHD